MPVYMREASVMMRAELPPADAGCVTQRHRFIRSLFYACSSIFDLSPSSRFTRDAIRHMPRHMTIMRYYDTPVIRLFILRRVLTTVPMPLCMPRAMPRRR